MSMGTVGAVVSIAGTAYGAYQQNQMAEAAGRDPFGSGNRQHYQRRLRTLTENPDSIFRSGPFRSALDLGLQGVERRMASMGFASSGNILAGLMEFGQSFGLDWIKNQQQLYGQLAGAQMAPSYGAAVTGGASAMEGWGNAMGQLGSLMAVGGGGGTSYGGGGGVIGGGGFGSDTLGGADWSSFGRT